MITFEYPLNEKYRSYLRFEFLFLQIKESLKVENKNDLIAFFKGFFDLLDLTERCDIRHDLVKDLRLLTEEMQNWLKVDNVDVDAVNDLLTEIDELMKGVILMPKQFRFVKTNRFLTSLKQRFAIPAGMCDFDLPQYHFWLNSALDKRQKDVQYWMEHFTFLDKALTLFLKIKRSQGQTTDQTATNGFFQQQQLENCGFVIVEMDCKGSVYPMISGHKDRYSIRFMSADIEHHLSDCIVFKQTCC
ncbi:hypothetical protein JI57_04940 [Psychromonas sp. PRT-SC03]|nr:hypothetical protein JI57_04940 [Psychromonas sp. PRT-SC03]